MITLGMVKKNKLEKIIEKKKLQISQNLLSKM